MCRCGRCCCNIRSYSVCDMPDSRRCQFFSECQRTLSCAIGASVGTHQNVHCLIQTWTSESLVLRYSRMRRCGPSLKWWTKRMLWDLIKIKSKWGQNQCSFHTFWDSFTLELNLINNLLHSLAFLDSFLYKCHNVLWCFTSMLELNGNCKECILSFDAFSVSTCVVMLKIWLSVFFIWLKYDIQNKPLCKWDIRSPERMQHRNKSMLCKMCLKIHLLRFLCCKVQFCEFFPLLFKTHIIEYVLLDCTIHMKKYSSLFFKNTAFEWRRWEIAPLVCLHPDVYFSFLPPTCDQFCASLMLQSDVYFSFLVDQLCASLM
jgi:hypothetical protein